MTDDERDARIETLTDAIAETNRAVNALTTNVASLTGSVTSLTGDVASLSRLMRTHLVEDHDYPDIDDDE